MWEDIIGDHKGSYLNIHTLRGDASAVNVIIYLLPKIFQIQSLDRLDRVKRTIFRRSFSH